MFKKFAQQKRENEYVPAKRGNVTFDCCDLY